MLLGSAQSCRAGDVLSMAARLRTGIDEPEAACDMQVAVPEGRVQNELEKLYTHIEDIEIAMLTTRRADGHLQSRAMATQKRAEGPTCGL